MSKKKAAKKEAVPVIQTEITDEKQIAAMNEAMQEMNRTPEERIAALEIEAFKNREVMAAVKRLLNKFHGGNF